MDTDMRNEVLEQKGADEGKDGIPEPAEPVSIWRPQDADREQIKVTARRKAWSSNASPKARFIPAKPLPTVHEDGQKRVAVYARVSTKHPEQVSSIVNQERYYRDKIIQPGDEKEYMSFKVPEKLFVTHKSEFTINSKRFVGELLRVNGLDPAVNHPLVGAYSEKANSVIFNVTSTERS